jgi:hypothetical protein
VPGLRAALATVALAGVLAGAATAAGTPDRTSLALMPLPRSALGPAAAALPLDRDSGVVANRPAAENATESVTARKLARLGRITGHALDYNDAGAAALRSGHGLIEVETAVELYATAAAAAGGLAFTVEAFDPGRLGADRFACDGVVRMEGKRPIYDVDDRFRTGRLVGDVDVTSADRAGTRRLARSLAAKLERRIAGSEAMGSEQLVLRFGGLAGSDVASFRPRRDAVQGGDEAQAVIATVKLKNGSVLAEGFVILRFGSTTELSSVEMPLGGRIPPPSALALAHAEATRVSRGLHLAPVA